MYVTKEIAAKMEACIKQSHIEVTKRYSQGKILEINGGAACFSGVDSFLSQVIGWGFSSSPKHIQSELDSIEEFYKGLKHQRVDIELCPLVGNFVAEFLSHRGYRIAELNNVSYIDITEYQPVDIHGEHLEIREILPNEAAGWAKRVAQGFGYPEAKDQFLHYIQATGVRTLAVFNQDKIVAGATIAMHGDVCDLGVTSTLRAYRGQNLQKKLLYSRLNLAKQQGLSLATVTTEPGSISDLNIQKVGFRCAYTRIKVTLGH